MDAQHLKAVTERDIDLLVLEEFHVSPQFRGWFLQQCRLTADEADAPASEPDAQAAEFLGAWHSVTDPLLGESDLILVARTPDQVVRAVLIEDKVSAPPQKDQAQRYRQRGEGGVEAGEWDQFTTCLIAPERYLSGSAQAPVYDVSVPYEAIRDFFAARAQSSERAAYRARVIDLAIDQQRRGYSPEEDPRVTALWKAYWEVASEEFPELGMSEPGTKPSRARWIDFRGVDLGPARRIVHKLDRGCVDLEIPGAADRLDELREKNADLLGADIEVAQASQSAAFRIAVPVVDPYGAFERQVREARQGMKAAYRLLYLARILRLS